MRNDRDGSVRARLLLGALLTLGCTSVPEPRLADELAAARTVRIVPMTPSAEHLAKSMVQSLETCGADVSLVSNQDADVVVTYEETSSSCKTYHSSVTIPAECRDSTGSLVAVKATLTVARGSMQFRSRSDVCPSCAAALAGQKIGRAWCEAVRPRSGPSPSD